MAKKTKKEIKKLKKAVGKLQDQNEELSEKLTEALEEQAEEIRSMKAALESRREANGQSDEEEIDATEPAGRRAEELGVDLSEVEGTGSGGRILVSDVEEAADSDDSDD